MSDEEKQETPEAPAATTTSTPPPVPTRPRRRWGRMLLRLILLIVIPVAAIIAGGYWYEATGRYVSTENAYVKSHVIAVSPNIDGRVTNVFVEENQRVKSGDLLFKLDPEPYWMMVRMSDAKRETARQEIESTRAEYHQIIAEIGRPRRTSDTTKTKPIVSASWPTRRSPPEPSSTRRNST